MPNPYNILPSEESPYFFKFTTEDDVLYSCYFNTVPHISPMLGIYDLQVRDFSFYPSYPETPDFKKKEDARILDTVNVLLRDYYFSSPDRILVYTCDDSEGEQRARARQILFKKWARALSDIVDHHEVELDIEEDDITLYGGILVHKACQHPGVVQTELFEKAPTFVLEKYGYS